MSATDIPPILTQTHNVGGLTAYVSSLTDLSKAGKPVAVLFMLHGRLGTYKHIDGAVTKTLELSLTFGPRERDLVIVTFDHRNHGERQVDKQANHDWKADTPNPRHAIDMYAIQ
ncbi:hypothetical protein M422DRAFT_776913, partial [Sphaerobolus stellatus SS14]